MVSYIHSIFQLESSVVCLSTFSNFTTYYVVLEVLSDVENFIVTANAVATKEEECRVVSGFC